MRVNTRLVHKLHQSYILKCTNWIQTQSVIITDKSKQQTEGSSSTGHNVRWTNYLLFVALIVSVPRLKKHTHTPGAHPLLGEKLARATDSTHLQILSRKWVQCYLLLLQLYSDLGDFDNGFCHSIKITTAGSNLNMEFLRLCPTSDLGHMTIWYTNRDVTVKRRKFQTSGLVIIRLSFFSPSSHRVITVTSLFPVFHTSSSHIM